MSTSTSAVQQRSSNCFRTNVTKIDDLAAEIVNECLGLRPTVGSKRPCGQSLVQSAGLVTDINACVGDYALIDNESLCRQAYCPQ
jgi:hypothetical protein